MIWEYINACFIVISPKKSISKALFFVKGAKLQSKGDRGPLLVYEINILYILICFDNKNIMPQYKTLDSRSKGKTPQHRTSTDDP